MININIWKRLLWKEARESGLVMVIPLGAPLLANWASEEMKNFIWLINMLVVPLSITLWATMKAQQKGSKRGEWLQLPMTSGTDWLASFIFPMLIAGIVGAWYGYWESSSMLPAFNLPADTLTSAIYGSVLLGALCMMAGFAICYMTAVTFSLPLAILMSIAWVIPTGFLANSISSPLSDANHPLLTFLIMGIAGAGAASIIVPALSRRTSKTVVRMWTTVFILLIPLSPSIQPICVYVKSLFYVPSDKITHLDAHNSNGNLSVVALPESTPDVRVLLFTDKLRGFTVQKSFDTDVFAASIMDDGTVYIVKQHPGNVNATIFRWDIHTNVVDALVKFPAGMNAFSSPREPGFTSSGHYLAIVTPSQIGDISDLWIFDLQRKVGKLVVSNQYVFNHPVFSGDQMYVSCGSDGLVVDLRNMTTQPIDFPRLPRR